MATCYRHRDRETGVACSNCANPICPDCMTPTPVGMRCPDCARNRQRAQTLQSLEARPYLTFGLIVACVLLYLLSGNTTSIRANTGSAIFNDLALLAPLVDQGEYWRLVSYGFLHAGILHLGLNMYVLYWLGQMLEPSLGTVRFGALYLTSLIAGALGAMVFDPTAWVVGASGGVFGLMGATFVLQRARGINPMQSGLGPMLLLNLALTFVISNISVGGHVGGLFGGALFALVLDRLAGRRLLEQMLAGGLIALVIVVAAVAVAGRTGF